jgi:hypothetical protein
MRSRAPRRLVVAPQAAVGITCDRQEPPVTKWIAFEDQDRRERYPWLRPGDVVELSVDRLGSQRAAVLAASA